jgi:hypothetical protein
MMMIDIRYSRIICMVIELFPTLVWGFACIAVYFFIKRLVQIKNFESPLVKLEFAQ